MVAKDGIYSKSVVIFDVFSVKPFKFNIPPCLKVKLALG